LPMSAPAAQSWVANIASGTYDPTVTIVANADTAVVSECQWIRVINAVSVSGAIDIDATAAGIVSVRLTLPLISNIVLAADLAGVGGSTTTNTVAAVIGDTTNNAAIITFTSTGGAETFYFNFTYRVI
jgi:hypothetical protein